jgi:hypothetical protein
MSLQSAKDVHILQTAVATGTLFSSTVINVVLNITRLSDRCNSIRSHQNFQRCEKQVTIGKTCKVFIANIDDNYTVPRLVLKDYVPKIMALFLNLPVDPNIYMIICSLVESGKYLLLILAYELDTNYHI